MFTVPLEPSKGNGLEWRHSAPAVYSSSHESIYCLGAEELEIDPLQRWAKGNRTQPAPSSAPWLDTVYHGNADRDRGKRPPWTLLRARRLSEAAINGSGGFRAAASIGA